MRRDLDDYIEHLKVLGLAEMTLYRYRLYLGRFLEYLAYRGVQTVREVTTSHVDDYWNRLRGSSGASTKKPLSSATINEHLDLVRKFFSFLEKRNRVLLNPARRICLRRRPPPLKRVLTEEEMVRLLDQPDVKTPLGLRDRAMMELLYSAGLRSGEVFKLNMEDVDFRDRYVFVREGKGGKDRVAPAGAAALRWVGEYMKTARSRAQRRDNALFLSRWGGRRMRRGDFAKRVQSYADKARLGGPVGLHGFRRACATHMLRHGANIRRLQEMLGHRKPSTTQIYTRIAIEDLKAVHRKRHPRGRALKT